MTRRRKMAILGTLIAWVCLSLLVEGYISGKRARRVNKTYLEAFRHEYALVCWFEGALGMTVWRGKLPRQKGEHDGGPERSTVLRPLIAKADSSAEK